MFELYNIANAQDSERLAKEAKAGRLTKEAFVTQMIEPESRAAEKVRAFYIHVFLPWAKEQHAPTDAGSWYIGARSHPREDLVLSHIDKRGAYWRGYEHRYDMVILESLVCMGENVKAAELVAKLQKEATTSEERASIYIARGLAYQNGGDRGKAIADFTEAIRLNPKDSRPYVSRGWAYTSNDEWGKAILDYDEAIRLDSNDAGAYGKRGLAQLGKGELDKAIADFSEVIRLNPGSFIAYYSRGAAYKQKGDDVKADADFAEAKRLGSTLPDN